MPVHPSIPAASELRGYDFPKSRPAGWVYRAGRDSWFESVGQNAGIPPESGKGRPLGLCDTEIDGTNTVGGQTHDGSFLS
jgi:hypothetical protein